MITNLAGEYRPVIWTMTPDSNGLYSLYIEGSLYKSHMTFDEFYPIYVRFVAEERVVVWDDRRETQKRYS